MRQLFAIKELEKTVQVFRASYPESGQFDSLLFEVKKTHLGELVELLKSHQPTTKMSEAEGVGAGESSPAPDGSALRYRCEGGDGCVKPGCEIVAIGKPWDEHEKLYMCPYNHWRSARWEEIKADAR